jgi:N4-gp56 family major capsid protein
MADFAVNITGSTELDEGMLTAFYRGFLLSAYQENIFDGFCTVKERLGAKSIEFTKYGNLTATTTPLDEYEDVDAEAMSDDKVVLTPAEYGKVVTRSALINFQTGGKVDLAAAKVVGINKSRSTDMICIKKIMESGDLDERFALGSESAFDDLAVDNTLTSDFLNGMYNVMARKNIVPFDLGMYVAVMHDDLITQLRADVGAGGWMDVNKYTDPSAIFRNEVGSLHGLRIVRDNNLPLTDNTDTITCSPVIVLGQNAIGRAVCQEPSLVITGPFDKLGRFLNIGWYGVIDYGIIDPEAVLLSWFATNQ